MKNQENQQEQETEQPTTEREQPMTDARRAIHIDDLRRMASDLRGEIIANPNAGDARLNPLRAGRRALRWAVAELETG